MNAHSIAAAFVRFASRAGGFVLALLLISCGKIDQSVKNEVNTLNQRWAVLTVKLGSLDNIVREFDQSVSTSPLRIAEFNALSDSVDTFKRDEHLATYNLHLKEMQRWGLRFGEEKDAFREARQAFIEFHSAVNDDAFSTEKAQAQLKGFYATFDATQNRIVAADTALTQLTQAYNRWVAQAQQDLSLYGLQPLSISR
jgi:hypothetical protein